MNVCKIIILLIVLLNFANPKTLKRHLTCEQQEQLSRQVRMNKRSILHEDSSNPALDNVTTGNQYNKHNSRDSPSYQLELHTLSYEPEGYTMSLTEINSESRLVSFVYDKTNSFYDKYIFRIRFHGKLEYATEKKLIQFGVNGTNQLLLKKFDDYEYIVCVTLFSNDSSVPPLSTTGMCVDVLIGEKFQPHHSVTGLLSPLLLCLVAALLVIITIVDYFKKKYVLYKKKKSFEIEIEIQQRKQSVHRSSVLVSTVESIQLKTISNNQKNNLSKLMNRAERRVSIWDERVKRLARLTDENEQNLNNSFQNPAYSADDQDLDQNKDSIDTLGHLLNNKPWLSPKSINGKITTEEPTKQALNLKY